MSKKPLFRQSPDLDHTPGLSLFWRTFILVGLLVTGSVLTWMQTFRALDYEPRQIAAARQAAALVNLSRTALRHSDAIARVSIIKTLREQENLHIVPREPTDVSQAYDQSSQQHQITQEIRTHLGPDTQVARSVNGEPGLWIGFAIDADGYWILIDPSRLGLIGGGTTWIVWTIAAAVLSLIGAAVISRLINRPLKNLSFAASRLREGDYAASLLDESAMTSEIREVNAGFNRMAAKLAKIEDDRAIMLAGISHDLRTPLARLRLEAEMSVVDEQAKQYMANDIEQLDAIIDKFLDYAKPGKDVLLPVNIQEVLHSCVVHERKNSGLHIAVSGPEAVVVKADRVELGRIFTNLIENARKYGQSPDGNTYLEISITTHNDQVFIKFRDYGKGVPQKMLAQLTQPFFRGDVARTHATGAGLGLAIIDKTVSRMGGAFHISNAEDGGLICRVRLASTAKLPSHAAS